MSFRVSLTKTARDDLDSISAWIEDRADTVTADAYDARIRAFIRTLAAFPRRGTPQDDLEPGLRSVTFERRLRIAYRIRGDAVELVRIFNGARDVKSLFDG